MAELVDAAEDLHAVHPHRLAVLLHALVDPLEAELEGLATRIHYGLAGRAKRP